MANKIIAERDVNALIALDEWSLIDCLVELVYDHYGERSFDTLNHAQQVLYLCMKLEGACQADTILSLVEDGLLPLLPRMIGALRELGAPLTADLVRKFTDLLPAELLQDTTPDLDWFGESEACERAVSRIDCEISDYPDGLMRTLYHRYVSDRMVAEQLLDIP